MKVLILHHVEPCWDKPLKERGSSFYELQRDIYKFVRGKELDNDPYYKIILHQYEIYYEHGKEISLEEQGYYNLSSRLTEVHNYGYGWIIESFVSNTYKDEEFYAVNDNRDEQNKYETLDDYEDDVVIPRVEKELEDKGEYTDLTGQKWILGYHSSVIPIPSWLQQLADRNHIYNDVEVDICGCFEDACILDLTYVLNYLNLPYTRLDHLIV